MFLPTFVGRKLSRLRRIPLRQVDILLELLASLEFRRVFLYYLGVTPDSGHSLELVQIQSFEARLSALFLRIH